METQGGHVLWRPPSADLRQTSCRLKNIKYFNRLRRFKLHRSGARIEAALLKRATRRPIKIGFRDHRGRAGSNRNGFRQLLRILFAYFHGRPQAATGPRRAPRSPGPDHSPACRARFAPVPGPAGLSRDEALMDLPGLPHETGEPNFYVYPPAATTGYRLATTAR